jgi:hypothetical protein
MGQQQQFQGAMPRPSLSEAGHAITAELAHRHGFGEDAVVVMLVALQRGRGEQAQFSHPEFGGMGQWSRGGMLMIGDMFNDALKARVGALAQDAAARLGEQELFVREVAPPPFALGLADLGAPSATGSQNDTHYAFYPAARRLAVTRGGATTLYDTANHQILGFGQQQGGGTDLSFTSQHGPIALSTLRRAEHGAPTTGEIRASSVVGVEVDRARSGPEAEAASPDTTATPTSCARPAGDHTVILETLEGLAALHAKGVVTDDEFAAKKAELLARL